MPISDYNSSAALNTTLGTIPVGPGMAREKVNDAIQQLMADLAAYKGGITQVINVKDAPYNAVGNGVTDDTGAIQAALTAAGARFISDPTWEGNAGIEVYIPGGSYRITSTLNIPNYVTLRGDGRKVSTIVTANDIVMLKTAAAANASAVNIGVMSMAFVKERTTSTTYHIDLVNPALCNIRDVVTFTKISDSIAGPTYFGGIRMDKDASFSGLSFINRVHDCFIQNGGILFDGVTDGEVTDSYVYGHNVNHCIKFINGAGNYNIAGNNLTSPQANGAVWLASADVANIRITGNFFDGLVVDLLKGHGILSDSAAQSVLVHGNHFTHQLSGIRAVQPYFWTVTGNHFRNCNNKDPGATAGIWPDIEIIGLASYNTIEANTHQQLASRSPNQAYAILETTNGSGTPVANSYTGNAIFGVANAYAQNPNGLGSLLVAGAGNRLVGNAGYSGDKLADRVDIGDQGISISKAAVLAASGTLDMIIATGDYFGNPAGFVGTLYVSTTRTTAGNVSRRAAYAVFCRGTTSTFTQIGVDHDGSGGGASFTVTTPSNGTIRFTDTSANSVDVRLTFIGSKSLA